MPWLTPNMLWRTATMTGLALRPIRMRAPFTSFACSRFVDPKAVVECLRALASRLKESFPQVKAVYLFGSFASGTATPRSDADIAVEAISEDRALLGKIHETAFRIFSEAPVPAEIFLLSSARIQSGNGIERAIRTRGIRLA